MLTFYAAKFTRDLKLMANLHICLHCVHRMSRRYTLNFTVRKRSIWDLKRARQEKSPWVKTKKKTGLKKTNKVKESFDQKRLSASDKGSWHNQLDVVSKPSSSKDIGASQMKITTSEAEELIDVLSDSGDSNTGASP